MLDKMTSFLVPVIFLAFLILTECCVSLKDATCLEENLDNTLLQMARLHKSLITSQNATIQQNIKDLRTELILKIGKLETENDRQKEKLTENEKKIEELERTQSNLKDEISYLRGKLDKTADKLADSLNITQSLQNSLNNNINSVNATLLGKLRELREIVETEKVDLDSVESEVDLLRRESVKVGKDGRIDRAVLPGAYKDYTLEEVTWGSLHLAATAACRGYVASGGTGNSGNVVIPVTPKSSCTKTCASTVYRNCDAAVTLIGYLKRSATNGRAVGEYYNYGCGHPHSAKSSEITKTDEKVLRGGGALSYCCCRA